MDGRVDGVLGHDPVRRVLAAGDHDQTAHRRGHRVLPGQLAGRVGFAGQQGPQPGIHPDHVLADQLVGQQGVGVLEQVVDVGLARRRVRLVQVPVGVGGADDPVAAPRDDEEQALLGPGDQTGRGVDPVPRHDQVDAFGGPDLELAAAAEHLLDLVDPDPGRVDRLPGPDLERLAAFKITDADAGDPVVLAEEADHPGAVGHQRAVVRGGPGQHHRVPGVVDLALVERDRADQRLPVGRREQLQGLAPGQVPQMMRYATAGAHHVVDADAEPGVAAVDHLLPQRIDELHRLGQVRCQPVQRQRPLLEGLEHQARSSAAPDSAARRGTACWTGSRCPRRSRGPRPGRPAGPG